MFKGARAAYVIVSNPIAVRLQFSTKPNLVAPHPSGDNNRMSFLLSPRWITTSQCRYIFLPIASLQNHNLSRKNEAHKKFGEANFGSDNKEIPGRTTEKISVWRPSVFTSSNPNPLHKYSITLHPNKLNPIQEPAFESCSCSRR